MPSRSILLVEDEPRRARTYLRALAGPGIEVLQAKMGQEALTAIETKAVDVIVIGVPIRSVTSFDFVHRVRQRLANVPVIMVLDALDNEVVRRGFTAGVQQYLVKPDADLLKVTVLATLRMLSLSSNQRVKPREGAEEILVTSTHAQNAFGEVLKSVIQGRRVVITKHNTRAAVVLPYDQYLEESGAQRLNTLSAEFDKLLADMQTEKALAGVTAAFDATPAELGKAAVAAARKRR